MDPLTAAMNAVTAALNLARDVYAATPADLKTQSAADWAKTVHNAVAFFTALQDKINQAIKAA